MSHKVFDELSYEKMSEIKDLRRKIELNILTYYFKSKSIIPINFIDFRAPLHLFRDIFTGNIKPEKAEEYKKKFK